MSLLQLLHHKLSLSRIDPLGGGLAEEIVAEQLEPEAIRLEDDIEAEVLSQKWQEVVDEAEKDPTWSSFSDDE